MVGKALARIERFGATLAREADFDQLHHESLGVAQVQTEVVTDSDAVDPHCREAISIGCEEPDNLSPGVLATQNLDLAIPQTRPRI
jgi:hypothetical protein